MSLPAPQERLINIGYGNLLLTSRVVAIVDSASAPMRRLREEAKDGGRLIDATMGHKTRSIIITDSNHVILCGVHAETLGNRILQEEKR